MFCLYVYCLCGCNAQPRRGSSYRHDLPIGSDQDKTAGMKLPLNDGVYHYSINSNSLLLVNQLFKSSD